MSSVLNTTIAVSTDHYLITGSLAAGGTLPREIFIYENTGNAQLGEFFGTCNVQELGRLQIFVPGNAIPLFGNRYVRNDQIKIKVSLKDDPNAVVAALVQNVKDLSKAYAAQTTVVQTHQIP